MNCRDISRGVESSRGLVKIHPESGNCSEMAAKVGRAASCREERVAIGRI